MGQEQLGQISMEQEQLGRISMKQGRQAMRRTSRTADAGSGCGTGQRQMERRQQGWQGIGWQRVVGLAVCLAACTGGVVAQAQLPAPSPVEQRLAAAAKHMTEVTLNQNMLQFAAKFMNGKDSDKDKEVAKLIQGLQGVYVREYDFDKDHAYTQTDLDALRTYMQGQSWSPMVQERTRGVSVGTDVYVKLVNGQMQGLYVLDAEERELDLVLILGPINVNELNELGGSFGIPRDAVKKAQKKVTQ